MAYNIISCAICHVTCVYKFPADKVEPEWRMWGRCGLKVIIWVWLMSGYLIQLLLDVDYRSIGSNMKIYWLP